MNWFYSKDGQQAGPVADEELAGLVRDGSIQPSTLVWHSGLAGWQPFSAISASLPVTVRAAGAAVEAGQAVCAECGGVFPADEVVQVDGHNVCARCKPLFLQKMQQGAANVGLYGAPTLQFAGFWIRFGAALLDWLILIPFYIVYYVVYFALFGGQFSRIMANPQAYQPTATMQVGNLAMSFATMFLIASYSAFCLSRYGGTPGKLICNLRVTRADGQRVTFLRAFGRYFAKYISKFILCLGYLFIVFDDQKRALHDYICDTRVSLK